MSYGETLFQGTWGEALDHARNIPRDRSVRIVSAEDASTQGFQERHRDLIDEIIAKAEALPASSVTNKEDNDPYK